jgi:hypothetical protein
MARSSSFVARFALPVLAASIVACGSAPADDATGEAAGSAQTATGTTKASEAVKTMFDAWKTLAKSQYGSGEWGFEPTIDFLYPKDMLVETYVDDDGKRKDEQAHLDSDDLLSGYKPYVPNNYTLAFGIPSGNRLCEHDYTNFGGDMNPYCDTLTIRAKTSEVQAKLAGQPLTLEGGITGTVERGQWLNYVRWQKKVEDKKFFVFEMQASSTITADKLIELANQAIKEGPKPGLPHGTR